MTSSWKWRRWRTWTLRRQLVLGVSGVVMVVLLVVAVLSVLTLRAQMTAMIDTHLAGSCDTFGHSLVKYRDGVGSSGNPAVPGPLKPLTEFTGQSPGNLIALIQSGRVVDSARFTDGEPVRAPASAVREIEDQSWTDNVPRTIYLDGLGSYRMQSRTGEDGERLISGVSLRQAHEAVARETAIVATLAALAVVVTALSTIVIVRVALRPLARVAATAAEVATLPLDRENHEITPRVPDSDTDPCTEVGLVGDTMNKLLDHVESALGERAASDRRMRQFITDASHELRTPLAAIQGYAELTRQDSSVLPDTTEYSLARIEAEAQRMSALVSDLLLLARLDEGQDLQTEDVDLADIVADAVNDAMVSAPGHGWLLDVEETSVWVRGDRARLHQLLANLLANARTHTPAGTTVVTGISTRRADDGTVVAELTVTDDGPGIDDELLPHLFERFVRADKSRSRQSGNAGLGLSIACSIAEAHGGAIAATSGGGKTRFVVELPAIAPPEQPSVDGRSEYEQWSSAQLTKRL